MSSKSKLRGTPQPLEVCWRGTSRPCRHGLYPIISVAKSSKENLRVRQFQEKFQGLGCRCTYLTSKSTRKSTRLVYAYALREEPNTEETNPPIAMQTRKPRCGSRRTIWNNTPGRRDESRPVATRRLEQFEPLLNSAKLPVQPGPSGAPLVKGSFLAFTYGAGLRGRIKVVRPARHRARSLTEPSATFCVAAR